MTFTATNGTAYSIMVGGWTQNPGPGEQDTFTLNINQGGPPPPANDDLANAEELLQSGPDEFIAEGLNEGATKETNEPNHAGNAGGHSVWYHWTAPANGSAVALTCADAGMDTLLGVYLATGFPVTTTVASNDDAADQVCSPNNPENSLTTEFPVTAGQDYKIAVDGHSGDEGEFLVALISIPPPPPNDNFANAELLSGLTDTTVGDNLGATFEPNEPEHFASALPGIDFPNQSIWYRWTAPQSGQATVSLCDSGAGFDSVLAVYTGAALNTLARVIDADDSCGPGPGLLTRVTFAATAATTYQIAVDGYNGSDAIDLDLTLVPTTVPGGGTLPGGGGQTTNPAACNAAKDAVSAAEAKLKKAKAKLKKAKQSGDADKVKKAKAKLKKAKRELADAKAAAATTCGTAAKARPKLALSLPKKTG